LVLFYAILVWERTDVIVGGWEFMVENCGNSMILAKGGESLLNGSSFSHVNAEVVLNWSIHCVLSMEIAWKSLTELVFFSSCMF
jgi:hypothetical protein